MRQHCPAIIPLTAIAALALGCAAEDQATRTDSAASAPTTVTVAVTDVAFRAPDTLDEGWTTFRLVNQGSELHMAQLVRLEQGKTLEEYVESYGEAFRTRGPRPPWAKRMGGPGAAAPGGSASVTQYLEPGSYAWVDNMDLGDGIPNVMQGLARPFTARASGTERRGNRRPDADVVMRLTDYAFHSSDSLRRGRQLIRVVNEGVEPHEVILARLPPGKTMADVHAWRENPQGPPPLEGAGAGGISALASGADGYFEVELAAGEYVLLCFVTAPDGRSHVAHGMFRAIRID